MKNVHFFIKLKIEFKCVVAGIYVAEMKVISIPVGSVGSDNETSSAVVTIQGFSEHPYLEVRFHHMVMHAFLLANSLQPSMAYVIFRLIFTCVIQLVELKASFEGGDCA